jgi:hypothetical protein
VIYCETDLFFVIVRTQLMNEYDLGKVKDIQNEYQLQSLGSYMGTGSTSTDRQDNFPEWKNGDELTVAFFKYLDVMLKLSQPVASEIDLRNRFAKLGIGTERGFDINAFDVKTQKAIEQGILEGLTEMESFVEKNSTDPLASAKIFGTRDFLVNSAKKNFQLDNFYVLRAAAAAIGIYGNSGSEAIYPAYLMESSGIPFNASKISYKITFQGDELPPVNAFWSLSIYDGITQLFINNSLDRYLLNSNMMKNYEFDDDGSLTLYIQKDSPGVALESNWLPAPDGTFYCVLRLYGPKQEALLGKWINPPMIINY